jgi:hypothetical protein
MSDIASFVLDHLEIIGALVGLLVPLIQIVVLRISRRRWWEVARLFPRLCPSVAYIAVVLSFNENMEDASLDFFSATVEIIPVLLLALILEVGALRIRGQGRIDVLANSVTAGYLILGLTVSLYGLAENDTSHADIVWASMAAGITGLIVAAALGRKRKSDNARLTAANGREIAVGHVDRASKIVAIPDDDEAVEAQTRPR